MIFKKYQWIKIYIKLPKKGKWYFLWLDRLFKTTKEYIAYINDVRGPFKIGKDTSIEVDMILYEKEPKDIIIQKGKK